MKEMNKDNVPIQITSQLSKKHEKQLRKRIRKLKEKIEQLEDGEVKDEAKDDLDEILEFIPKQLEKEQEEGYKELMKEQEELLEEQERLREQGKLLANLGEEQKQESVEGQKKELTDEEKHPEDQGEKEGHEERLKKIPPLPIVSTKQQKIDKRWRNFTLVTLFSAPLIISTISAIHSFDLFLIGNYYFLAYFLACAFEVLAISALISLRVLGVLGTGAVRFVWIAIIFLASIQVMGNIYSVFIKIDENLAGQMGELIGMSYGIPLKRLISCVLGSILPVTALVFLKVLASYWYKTQRETS